MLDIRALPDEDMTTFYAEMDRVIGETSQRTFSAGEKNFNFVRGRMLLNALEDLVGLGLIEHLMFRREPSVLAVRFRGVAKADLLSRIHVPLYALPPLTLRNLAGAAIAPRPVLSHRLRQRLALPRHGLPAGPRKRLRAEQQLEGRNRPIRLGKCRTGAR